MPWRRLRFRGTARFCLICFTSGARRKHGRRNEANGASCVQLPQLAGLLANDLPPPFRDCHGFAEPSKLLSHAGTGHQTPGTRAESEPEAPLAYAQ